VANLCNAIRRATLVGLVASAVLGGVGVPVVRADLFTFDPDGDGPVTPTDIDPTGLSGGLDFSTGSVLFRDGVARLADGPGQTFQAYFQTTLAGPINTNGDTIIPPGMNRTFEITAVASITFEVVNSLNGGGLATFRVASQQSSESFFDLYFDTSANANNLAGTGFADGQRILSATPFFSPGVDYLGNYTTRTVPDSELPTLDPAFGTNLTLIRSGSLTLTAEVRTFDRTYFVDEVQRITFNTTLTTPFNTTNASRQFWDGSGFVPSTIGMINGRTGPDILFQADGNLAVTLVPEPSALVLFGLGTGLIGIAVRRRRRSAA